MDSSFSDTDLQGFLYGPGGTLVASNDTSAAVDFGSVTTKDPFFTYTVTQAGTYIFGIQSSLSVTGSAHATGYDVFVSIASAGRSIWGTSGAELSDGWMGDDTIRGGAQGALAADTGGDTLRGYGGRDLLQGGGGGDSLIGGTDADRVLGGAGNDTIWGDDPAVTTREFEGNFNDVLSGGEGDDLIVAGQGRDTVAGGAGADTITDDASADPFAFPADGAEEGRADVLSGGEGDDLIRGGRADRLQGGAGNDELRVGISFFIFDADSALADGGEGLDQLVLALSPSLATPLVLRLDAEGGGRAFAGGSEILRILGIESVSAAGGSGADLLVGGVGGDVLAGGGAADTIDGAAGDDSLEGGTGDVLTGGEGNDGILVTGLTAALNPGAGNDTVTVQSGAAGIAFATGIGNDRVLLEAAGATVSLGAGNDTIDTIANNVGIEAGSGSDRIVLGRAVNAATTLTVTGAVVDAGAGNDTIKLYGGEALVIGGSGTADVLDLDLSHLTQAVELAFTGAGGGYLAAGTTHRVDWDEVERIRAVGGAGADLLEGGGGPDALDGGGGADTLRGGAGSDLFGFDLAGAEGDRLADFNGRGAEPGDSIIFLGFGTDGTVTALGGGAYRVAGSLGSATISISGRLDPTDYVFAPA